MPIAPTVTLTEQQEDEVTSMAQSRSLAAGYVFPAKLILLPAERFSFAMIRERLDTTRRLFAGNSAAWRWDWTDSIPIIPVKKLISSHPPYEPRSWPRRARSPAMDPHIELP
jgi:hypothetical protein